MIQLATDPNASRMSFRPAAQDAKQAQTARRGGHAWPFPSRYAARPHPQDAKPSAGDSGS